MTTKITKFTDENLVPLRNAVNDALGSVGKKFNVTFTLTRITALVDGLYASAELSLSTNTAEGVPQELAAWNDQNLVPLGLKKEWLGKTFACPLSRGGRWHNFTITGLNQEDKTYPVQASKFGEPNKRYQFAVDAIRRHFEPDAVLKETTAKRTAAADQGREDWKKYAESRSLKPEWLDQTFTYLGKRYKIIGLLPQSRKFCVRCIRLLDDSGCTCTPEMVREGMSKQSEVAA